MLRHDTKCSVAIKKKRIEVQVLSTYNAFCEFYMLSTLMSVGVRTENLKIFRILLILNSLMMNIVTSGLLICCVYVPSFAGYICLDFMLNATKMQIANFAFKRNRNKSPCIADTIFIRIVGANLWRLISPSCTYAVLVNQRVIDRATDIRTPKIRNLELNTQTISDNVHIYHIAKKKVPDANCSRSFWCDDILSLS